MSRKEKRKYKGLKFNYKLEGEDKVYVRRYPTVEDFITDYLVEEDKLPPHPSRDTEVFNVLWFGEEVILPERVKTLLELLAYVSFAPITVKEPLKRRKQDNYERKGRMYSLEEVLPFIEEITGQKTKDYDGDFINMDSLRYKIFSKSGTTCAHCGRVGTYFVKERNIKRGDAVNPIYHFNIYSNNKDGEKMICKYPFIEDNKVVYGVLCEDCVDKENKLKQAAKNIQK